MKNLILITLTVAICSLETSAQTKRWLSYEPAIVELEGRLVIQNEWGPPNFGEEPLTDRKEKVPVIVLAKAINVRGTPGDMLNATSVEGTRRVQLVFPYTRIPYKQLIGQKIVVKGSLFHAHTGHHYTPVLIWVRTLSPASTAVAQNNCLQTAREVSPGLSAETHRDFESKLAEARALFEKDPQNVEHVIWLGRRTAYLGRYKDAIKIYTDGIVQFPSDARLYRHRGHRYITLRCFDAAIADFETAARLIRGQPDEVEPDGLPNARNIPTSTLQSNIWYHLGLAHYLKGDFARALTAYREAEKVSTNPDMLVATTHWHYMTLRRLGRHKEAGVLLAKIKDDLDVIENGDYYKLLKIYKGQLQPEKVLEAIGSTTDSLSSASVGYGLGNWFVYNGQRAHAEKIFRQVTAGSQWASFGFIAAEVELKKKRPIAKTVGRF
ncbi:MAG TPA: DUF4431 domain-containing protein [Pyrinomonadaceae bacterium]|nr:DUF4431 domain-containing protein [Pyrinomonadaceae bacterium]